MGFGIDVELATAQFNETGSGLKHAIGIRNIQHTAVKLAAKRAIDTRENRRSVLGGHPLAHGNFTRVTCEVVRPVDREISRSQLKVICGVEIVRVSVYRKPSRMSRARSIGVVPVAAIENPARGHGARSVKIVARRRDVAPPRCHSAMRRRVEPVPRAAKLQPVSLGLAIATVIPRSGTRNPAVDQAIFAKQVVLAVNRNAPLRHSAAIIGIEPVPCAADQFPAASHRTRSFRVIPGTAIVKPARSHGTLEVATLRQVIARARKLYPARSHFAARRGIEPVPVAVDVLPARNERSIAHEIPIGANSIPPLAIRGLFALLARTALVRIVCHRLAGRLDLRCADRILRRRGSGSSQRRPSIELIGRIRGISCFLFKRIGNLIATRVGIERERRAWHGDGKHRRSEKRNDLEFLHHKARFRIGISLGDYTKRGTKSP